jgi:hypothetical protein
VPVTDWYVDITRRLMPYSLCRGAIAISICIVEQFGLAMMRVSALIAEAFISGTTSGSPFSILQADELSITTVPFSANTGAHSFDTDAHGGKDCNVRNSLDCLHHTNHLTALPLKITSLQPNVPMLPERACRQETASPREPEHHLPTIPVAPTTATFILLLFKKFVRTL